MSDHFSHPPATSRAPSPFPTPHWTPPLQSGKAVAAVTLVLNPSLLLFLLPLIIYQLHHLTPCSCQPLLPHPLLHLLPSHLRLLQRNLSNLPLKNVCYNAFKAQRTLRSPKLCPKPFIRTRTHHLVGSCLPCLLLPGLPILLHIDHKSVSPSQILPRSSLKEQKQRKKRVEILHLHPHDVLAVVPAHLPLITALCQVLDRDRGIRPEFILRARSHLQNVIVCGPLILLLPVMASKSLILSTSLCRSLGFWACDFELGNDSVASSCSSVLLQLPPDDGFAFV